MRDPNLPKLEQHDAEALAAGYSPAIRALDYFSVVSFFVVVIWQAVRLSHHVEGAGWLVVAAGLTGYLFADFVSGFVHWLADTWGSVDMPIIGKALLRPFREHHVDPEAICRHDFIETNGNNCLICLPAGALALFVPLEEKWLLFGTAALLSTMIWVFGTNQFHKWAHLRTPNKAIAFLQKTHLVLPPDHHAIHHTAPFATHYCITAGWMNWPLSWTRFFRILERGVTASFGILPRRDDLGEKAAEAVQAAHDDEEATEPGAAAEI